MILSFVLILITFNDERKIRDILFSSILISFALDHLYRVFFQLICHNSNIFYNGKKVPSTILLCERKILSLLSYYGKGIFLILSICYGIFCKKERESLDSNIFYSF